MRAPYYCMVLLGRNCGPGLKVSCFHSWTFCHHHLFVWIAMIAQYDDIYVYTCIYIYIMTYGYHITMICYIHSFIFYHLSSLGPPIKHTGLHRDRTSLFLLKRGRPPSRRPTSLLVGWSNEAFSKNCWTKPMLSIPFEPLKWFQYL